MKIDDLLLDRIMELRAPRCFHCGRRRFARIKKRKVYACHHCGSHFSPTGGTVLAKSRTPLTTWAQALILLDGGYSGLQVSKRLGLTYKTAWRIKHVAKDPILLVLKSEYEKLLSLSGPATNSGEKKVRPASKGHRKTP